MKTMTQEEVLEYNKRCAEFLKWEFTTFKEVYNHINDFKGNQYDSLEELQFHSDWNWIINIVEAIEKLNILVIIQSNFCQIQELGNRENNFNPKIISSLYSKSKQKAVIQAINQFLIWYNNENKTN